jgi:Spy/CpxP family protein refolding chaperone
MAPAEETDVAEKTAAAPTGREMRLAGAPEAFLVDRNAESLGLDAKTVAAVKALAEEARASASKNRDEFQAAVREMNALLAGDLPNGEAVDRQADELARVWGSGLKARLHTSVRVRELLTAEQRRQLGELRSRPPQRQQPGGRLNPPIGPAPAIAPPPAR